MGYSSTLLIDPAQDLSRQVFGDEQSKNRYHMNQRLGDFHASCII